MKNWLKVFLLVLSAELIPALANAQQNLLVQTTLSAALAAPATPGAPPVPYATVQIASATGITVGLNPTQTLNTQNFWVLFIDREEMAIVGINGTTLQVIRGYNSTVATSHASGQMVLYGKAAWFFNADPGTTFSQGGGGGVSGGTTCTVAGQFAFPWVNVRTGNEWACSPTTLTYVPWFNNALSPLQSADFGTVASVAGATAVQGPFFRVSGTNAITSWTLPVGFNNTAAGAGTFCVYPTAAFTTTATNNIAKASTAVAGQTMCMTWNASTSKFSASY